MNEYIAEIYTKIICNIFFWSLRCSFASNTADFEISIFNLTHRYRSKVCIIIVDKGEMSQKTMDM